VTPLMMASLKKDITMIEVLLKNGADCKMIDKKNEWNASFYVVAQSKGSREELLILDLFIKCKLFLFILLLFYFSNNKI
jgi:ankyrin repeat protein